MQNFIKIYQVINELRAFDHELMDQSSTNPCHRFAYQCLDNVKMHKYAKFDQNTWTTFAQINSCMQGIIHADGVSVC